jgi:hypothetical protein
LKITSASWTRAWTRADACDIAKIRVRAVAQKGSITFYVEHDPEPSQDDPEPSQGNAGHAGSFVGSTIGIPSKRGVYFERQFPDGGVGGIDELAAADAASSSMVASMVSNAAMSFLPFATLLAFAAFLLFSSAFFSTPRGRERLRFFSALGGGAISICCRWQVQDASVYPDALRRCVGCRHQRPGGGLLPTQDTRADHILEPYVRYPYNIHIHVIYLHIV